MAQDRPTASELLSAIADLLREEVTPVLDKADPRLGFLSHARSLADSTAPNAGRMIFNDRLDAAIALFFMAIVLAVIQLLSWMQ